MVLWGVTAHVGALGHVSGGQNKQLSIDLCRTVFVLEVRRRRTY